MILNDYRHFWLSSLYLAFSMSVLLLPIDSVSLTLPFSLFHASHSSTYSPLMLHFGKSNIHFENLLQQTRSYLLDKIEFFCHHHNWLCSFFSLPFSIDIFAHFRELKTVASIERKTVEKSILHLFNWCRWRWRSHSVNVFLRQVNIHCTKIQTVRYFNNPPTDSIYFHNLFSVASKQTAKSAVITLRCIRWKPEKNYEM